MEKPNNEKSIDELLREAANFSAEAIHNFYLSLFTTQFCVPTRDGSLVESTDARTGATEAKIIPARNIIKEGPAIFGEHGNERHDFATVTLDGRRYLPFFTDEANLHSWLGPEAAFRKTNLDAILWSVKGESWLYLNPNQDFGKEFSPWEIEQLRRGPEAVDDLVADQLEETAKEVSFTQDTSLYPDFRARLHTMLDIYEEIEEAFLLSVTEENARGQNVLLGIRQTGLTAEKQAYLRDEIDFARAATLPENVSAAVLFDLNEPKSANSKLFNGALPFYIAQKSIESAGQPAGFISKLLKRKNPKG